MLAKPVSFLDQIGDAIGLKCPAPLPKSTPTTIAYRYISEFLTHSVGRLEAWECRNGIHDSSGWDDGNREEWFDLFPATRSAKPPLPDARIDRRDGYWFLIRKGEPRLCLDAGGRLYKLDGTVHDIGLSYKKHRRIWRLITETALDLLP